jgi:pimeloyl-ACP methyl ester carboxylesterase
MHLRLPWLALLFAWLAVAPNARAADPVFRVTPDTLRVDKTGSWRVHVSLESHSEWGLYPGSLDLEMTREDPDSSAEPRRDTLSLEVMVRSMLPVSAGDASGFDWSGPAAFERGTMVFRIVASDAHKNTFALADTVHVVGSALADAHPPVLLDVNAHRVEMAIFAADSARRPAPALLFVPPSGTAARSLLRWALAPSLRGITVGIVSLPGSGRSSGSPDRAGPASVAAVDAALARLLREPGADRARVVLWGEGDGATAALLVAARHPELTGVIAMDASFDPWATYRALPEDGRAAFVREAGRDSAGWRARSPLSVAQRITAPVLVVQSAEAKLPASAPAAAFVAARTTRKLPVEAHISALAPQPLDSAELPALAFDFLTRRTQHH